MKYEQLQNKLIKNRQKIRTSKNQSEIKKLIIENHELMQAMDKMWN